MYCFFSGAYVCYFRIFRIVRILIMSQSTSRRIKTQEGIWFSNMVWFKTSSNTAISRITREVKFDLFFIA